MDQRKLSRRIVLLAVLATGCSKPSEPAPSGSAPQQAAEAKAAASTAEAVTVRIGYQKIGSPFLLKERAESLTKALEQSNAKVEWIEFQAGPPILEAMRGGAVDVGYVGETPPVFAQAGGVPFVYVARDPSAPKSEAILVPKNSKITKVSELKGKRVAVNRGSNVHYLLHKALEAEKLALTDVDVVFLAPADARSAFDTGKVDAWVIWDPFQAAAEIAGARVLRDGEGLVQNQFFYVARREFAEKNAELVRVVLKEFETLSQWAGAHPEEASTLLAKSSGIAYDALLLAEKRHLYGLKSFNGEAVKQQQEIADAFSKIQVIPKEIKIADNVLPQPLYGDAR
ncbi:MAG: aliphatic sulfonate ABC transporter substrate-binding protein [Polyangiales bacterium]